MPKQMTTRDYLNMVWEFYGRRDFAVCNELCKSLLRRGVPDDMALECHTMLATAGDPEALYHSIEANRLARNFLEQNQESDAIAEVFYLSQEILRKAQAEASAARGRPAVTQQAANVGPANVPSRPASRRIRSSFRGPRPPPARSTRKSSYTAEDGTKWECTPTLRTIKEEEE